MDLVAREENHMVGGEEYVIILVKEVGRPRLTADLLA
jgi:hypothetical protein